MVSFLHSTLIPAGQVSLDQSSYKLIISHKSLPEIMGLIAFGGFGVGCVTQASMIAMQASVSKDDLGMICDWLVLGH